MILSTHSLDCDVAFEFYIEISSSSGRGGITEEFTAVSSADYSLSSNYTTHETTGILKQQYCLETYAAAHPQTQVIKMASQIGLNKIHMSVLH